MIDEIYSKDILRLAADLPHAGRLERPDGTGERTAKLCGSRAVVDVRIGHGATVEDFAQDVKACALGQAAASIVGAHAVGSDLTEARAARDALRDMLKAGGEGPTGRFEGLRMLKPVADYPARHASTLVGIEALCDALETAMARTRGAGSA
ncbi:MAG: iron-sulfur cluster assembly scaffold protein [Alphaproteobacteria bacterium]|nr:iron-sulfur cluster assembly scaffold protein [Alphaproteobacteria bacterium]MBU1526907.1 iron-sulfur cluster assembly scaffold protein [Alphaproteobacteria bacterium]MBU2351825.1 iron-sulfur cluster assembly scaffold protein [Alphaproteobacteria bacterium]MBU2383765.1 iron-sulfur cluster assembly scaffold protein [Alphaproteobacteria bacterium]